MIKILKWFIGLVMVLVLLLVLVVLLLPIFFDPNDHKPEIQQALQKQIGREISLNGPIGWSIFPWIAIELNDVTVVNEQGFSGDYLADIGTLSAQVKLMPLLKKDIQVDTVTLKSPTIFLQVAQSGQTNWQSILDYLADDEDTAQTEETSNIKVNIEGIIISDGQLNYRDANTGSTLKLTNLNFSSTAISDSKPADMSLKAQLELVESQLSGDLSTDFVVNHLLTEHALVVEIKLLALAGEMEGVPLRFRTQQGGQLDLGQDKLDLPEVNIEYANVSLGTSMMGVNLSTQPTYTGFMTVKPFNLDELLQQLGSGLENQAANQFSATLDWRQRGQVLSLTNLKAQLDDSLLSGQVSLSDLNRMAGDFTLELDQINLDDYLPQSEPTTTGETGEGGVDFGYLDGEISVAQLTAMGTTLNNIKLHLKTTGSELALRPLTADFYQGFLKTELVLALDKNNEQLVVAHNMQEVQAGPLLTDLMGENLLSGLGRLEANIKIDQPFSAQPLRTANGQLSYHLSDGDINGIDLVQVMQKALSLLNKSEAAEANQALKTEFGSMDLVADIVNGVLKTKQLSLQSPYFNLKGDIEVDLVQQSIKGTIQPMLTNIPPGLLDERYERLLNHRIPVSLSGSMLSPKVGIDVKQLLINTQKEKIEAKKDELKQDLLDSLLGKEKKAEKKGDKQSDNQSVEVSTGESPSDSSATKEQQNDQQQKEQQKEDDKDRLKRDLLEGLFKKSTQKKQAEEPEPQPEPQPDSGG